MQILLPRLLNMGRRSLSAAKTPEQQHQRHDQVGMDHQNTKNSPAHLLSKRTSRRVQTDTTPTSSARTPGRKKKATRGTGMEEKENDDKLQQVGGARNEDIKEEPEKGGNLEAAPVESDKGLPQAEGQAEDNESEREDEKDDSEEDEEAPEELGEGFYEVEAVRKKRMRKGKLQYYIKWQDWPESANTWEPYDNVKDCDDIIEEFEKSHMAKSGRKGRGKRKSGTYLSPQRKKPTSMSNAEEGYTSADMGDAINGPISTENHEEKPFGATSGGPSEIAKGPITCSMDMTSNGSKDVEVEKDVTTASQVPPVVSSAEKFEAENDVNVARLEDGIHVEGSQDKLMVSTGEAILRDVMVDTIGFVHNPVPDPSASNKIPQQEEIKNISELTDIDTSKIYGEIHGESSIPNGHCQVKYETPFTDIGQQEPLLHVTGNRVVEETKASSKSVTDEHPGKLTINDKCTGAKKRKQGFVRRVRQGLDSQEHVKRQNNNDVKMADVEQELEDSKAANGRDSDTCEGKMLPKVTGQQCEQRACSQSCNTLAIMEIIKAVTYSSSTANGKQDVSVLFKALRSDGQEVMVDNKFLRDNHPLLLLDFYEQHLRYSSAQ